MQLEGYIFFFKKIMCVELVIEFWFLYFVFVS